MGQKVFEERYREAAPFRIGVEHGRSLEHYQVRAAHDNHLALRMMSKF